MGLEPDANLQLNQATALTEYITDRLAKFWEQAAWPEWTTSELRQYRADWSGTQSYGQGEEVYYGSQNAYYRSLQAANLNNLPTDTAWWTPVAGKDLATYIAFEQSWAPSKIGVTWGVWVDDPRTVERPRPVAWWIGPEGIWVQSDATRVYVEFGLPAPLFTTVAWDVTRAYVPGDLVYYEVTGDCYAALQASTGVLPTSSAEWKRQDFPAALARTVKFAAIADALREDENVTKAGAWDVQAEYAYFEALEQVLPAMRFQPSYQVDRR